MKTGTKGAKALAEAFAVIAKSSNENESQANVILTLVHKYDHDEKSFSAAVREAYRQNGWNEARGRPSAGVELKRVPATVKQYISTVRKAFKYKLRVDGFNTFHELRKGVKDKRQAVADKAADPVMAGVKLTQPDELIQAPFHDIAVIYGALDESGKRKLAKKLLALTEEYMTHPKVRRLEVNEGDMRPVYSQQSSTPAQATRH